MGSLIPLMKPGVLLFDHELLHAFIVHFLHHSLPKQVARRDRLFRTNDLFQFHMALFVLKLTRRYDPLMNLRLKNVMLN